MTEDYLTENAVFGCILNSSVQIRCQETGNSKVRCGGRKLLTVGAVLKSAAGIKPCPALTAAAGGAPQPCQCILGTWLNVSGNKAANLPLLKKSTKNICTMGGGSIFVKLSGANGKVVNAGSIGFSKAADAGAEPHVKNEANAEGKSRVASGALPAVPEKSSVLPKENSYENLFCPYGTKPACKTCKYPASSVLVDNDSNKLRENYALQPASDKDAYDAYYEKILAEYHCEYWSYAAHHIISGNQVFRPHEELVRLANFYGYDINNAKNCIYLVSKEIEYGKQETTDKQVSAYDTMSLSGIQWHLGGHRYTFAKKEIKLLKCRIRLYTKKEISGPLKDYAALLEDELEKVEYTLQRRKVCRDDKRLKTAFIKRMDILSGSIKRKLAAFHEKPHRSFPYYVSKTAFSYTFSLPRTAKLLFVQRDEDGAVLLEKIRAERYEETINERGRSLKFKSIKEEEGKQNPQLFSLASWEEKRACIEFCENIEHIVLTQDVDTSVLPFSPEFVFPQQITVQPGLDVQEALAQYDTEIMVWLRDNQNPYTAPIKKIKERLKGCAS